MASYANALEANRKTRDEFDTARGITDGFTRASVTMNRMVHIKAGSVGFPEGDSGQVVIKFTTVNDYPCHLTFHTGGTGAEGAAGAFHVVIDEKGSETKKYYRFKPSIDNYHLKLDNIEYIPSSSDVYGKKKPLGDVHLDGAMKEVIQAVNDAKIYAGKPTAHVQQTVKSIMNERHIDKIKKDYTQAIKDVKSIPTFNKLWATDKKQDLIDYYNANKTNTKEVLTTKLNTKVKEMLEPAAAAEPEKKGGKRKQTRKIKRRKMNKRKTRRHRS